MLEFGNLKVTAHNFGFFRLDGGAMFGSVPKNLWSRRIEADAENCIRLATRCLVVTDDSAKKKFLIDVGMGEKWTPKQREIFAIENLPSDKVGVRAEEITDIILTHLHFDHAGGISKYQEGSSAVELIYPTARVILQRDNLRNARAPSVKEKASYLPENFEPFVGSNFFEVEGKMEVHPGIVVHQVNGHTRGQQWVEIYGGGMKLFYPTDLVPTQHHLPIPFHMGYDACAETVLKEKAGFLERARSEKAIVVFEHDASLEACTVILDDRGHYAVGEQLRV